MVREAVDMGVDSQYLLFKITKNKKYMQNWNAMYV